MAVFKNQVCFQCGIGFFSMLISSTFIMQPTAPLQNSWQSHLKKFGVFFSRKQQGAIKTYWNIYSCIFYHLCIMVTIFQVANSLLIFQQQYLFWHNTERRWNVIMWSQKTMSSKDDFLNIFDFTLPFFKALSQDG